MSKPKSTRARWDALARKAVQDVQDGTAARELWREMIARVNPLVKRGWRLSAWRPRPGTPAFRAAVGQIGMARQFNAERRRERAAIRKAEMLGPLWESKVGRPGTEGSTA